MNRVLTVLRCGTGRLAVIALLCLPGCATPPYDEPTDEVTLPEKGIASNKWWEQPEWPKEREEVVPETGREDTKRRPGSFARLFSKSRTAEVAEENADMTDESEAPADVSAAPDTARPKRPAQPKETEPAPAPVSLASENPVIRPGLVLKVTVLTAGTKEVEETEKRVSPEGTIILPLVGTVKVEGLTIKELADALTKRYGEFLREPVVDVDFVLDDKAGGLSPWGYVTVLGRVKSPGRINIPPTRDLTLSMAIQLAGGFDTSAKITGIRVTRKAENSETVQLSGDLQSVGSKGNVEGDIPLRDGDVVFVPERVF